MNKKRILMTLAITTALAVPFSAFAATSDTTAAKSIRGFFGIDTAKLTDTQKDDIKDYAQKAAELQKDFLNKMVDNGSITRDQADAEIKRIEDNLASGLENGVIPGFGFSQNLKKGKGGFDKESTFMKSAIDISKLTEQQKAELSDIYKQIADVQKENINKMVANGLMTKEQGEECIKKIDSIFNNTQKVGVSDGLKMFNGFGGFNFFNIKGFNSNLTEQQKADMQETADKMKNLQKELINKLVSFEVLTKEQGEAIINKMDAPDNLDSIKTFEGKMNGPDMMKGRLNERIEMKNRQGSTNKETVPNTTPVTPTAKS